jgi:hypothetical protein
VLLVGLVGGGIAAAVGSSGWKDLLLLLLPLPLSVPCLSLQRRVVAQNIKRLKDIGCYRGRRHIMVSDCAASRQPAIHWPTCRAAHGRADVQQPEGVVVPLSSIAAPETPLRHSKASRDAPKPAVTCKHECCQHAGCLQLGVM